jgi:hypothetical protein
MIFNFYLFNENITEFDSALKLNKLEGESPFIQLQPTPDLPATLDIQAYFQKKQNIGPEMDKFYIGLF